MNQVHLIPGTSGPDPGAGPEPGAATPPAPAHEPPPAGAGFMNVFRWALFAGLLALAAVSIGSYVISKQPKTTSASAKKVVYQCPMHPSYTSDKPGECPICGMTLEKIQTNGVSQSGPRRILLYRNPMNPSVTSPVPM